MPEALLNDLWVDAGRERERGVGVSQIVQPNLRQSRVLDVVLERARERPWPDRRPVLATVDLVELTVVATPANEGTRTLSIKAERSLQIASFEC